MFAYTVNKSRNFALVGLLALLIFFGGPYILHHIPASKQASIANGLLADVLITFPLAWYYFIIKPLKLRKKSILFIITFCCGAGYLIMPPQQQQYIIQLRKLSILAELGILVYALTKLKKIKEEYGQLQSNFQDTAYNLQQSIITVLGNTLAIRLLASELTILRFGLFCWYKTTPVVKNTQRFTIHREAGYLGLFGVVLFVCIIEVVAVHLLLSRYSAIAAAIVSVLSLYGIVFIVADMSAVLKSPVLIIDGKLLLRAGIRWRLLTVIDNVASITPIKSGQEEKDTCFNGSLLKGSANLCLVFKTPVKVNRIYRQPLEINRITISIDNANVFSKALLKLHS